MQTAPPGALVSGPRSGMRTDKEPMKRIEIPAKVALLVVSLVTAFRLEAQAPLTAGPASHLKEYPQGSLWEDIYMQIDRDKYIAGEDLWFSIYAIDGETGKLSARSAVAYVELLNPWNKPVIQGRFRLTDGRGQGNFLLPDSVSSGTYTIRGYTNWMKNFLPYNCFMQDLEICNPFKGLDFWRKGDSSALVVSQLTEPSEKSDNAINVQTDTIYNRREKVTLKLRIDDDKNDHSGNSEISISVTPARVASAGQWRSGFINSRTGPEHYGFENEGHYLSGRIINRDGNISHGPDFLYMSVRGKVADFKYAHVDTAGRFTFILPIDDENRNLILQPEIGNNNMVLEIEPSFSWILPESNCFRGTFSDSQVAVFSELGFNYQAEKIYSTTVKKEIVKQGNTSLKKRRFYGIPEMEIFLDDYIRLPVMQEVFFELLPGIILRSKKSGYEMKITNPLTGNFYVEPPLVMIDGVIINDLTVLAELNPETVEKIEVVKTPYLIGDLILHGIVNIITRSGDFTSITMPDYAVVLPYRVIDKSYTFMAPDYTNEQNLSRTPDLRNTLYWNPAVKTGRNGEAEIEFWTSDLPGKFTINIQGISVTGEKMSFRKSFIVR